MDPVKLSPDETDSIGSQGSNEERSFSERVKENPAKTAQEYYTLDKVYYQDKIWEVKQADYIDKKHNRNKKPYWNYLLRLEDGNKTVTVEQKHITDLATAGPNRPSLE